MYKEPTKIESEEQMMCILYFIDAKYYSVPSCISIFQIPIYFRIDGTLSTIMYIIFFLIVSKLLMYCATNGISHRRNNEIMALVSGI